MIGTIIFLDKDDDNKYDGAVVFRYKDKAVFEKILDIRDKELRENDEYSFDSILERIYKETGIEPLEFEELELVY